MRMFERSRSVSGVLWLASTLFLSGTVAAQRLGKAAQPTEASSRAHRERCVAAGRVVASRTPGLIDTATMNGFRVLAGCQETAGAALPGVWRTVVVGENPDELQMLLSVSAGNRDPRIASAVFAVARDATKEDAVREAALVVLASYVKPRITGRVQRSEIAKDQWLVSVGDRDHAGPATIDDAQRQQIVNAFQEIATVRTRVGQFAGNLLADITAP